MTNEELKKQIFSWRNSIGFQFISKPENDPISIAMSLTGANIRSMSIDELGEHLVVIDSYYTYLNAQMGQIFSRVQFNGDKIERVKLNQIKPFTEAVKVKIDLYKKIYDRKVREAKWRAYASSSRSGESSPSNST